MIHIVVGSHNIMLLDGLPTEIIKKIAPNILTCDLSLIRAMVQTSLTVHC